MNKNNKTTNFKWKSNYKWMKFVNIYVMAIFPVKIHNCHHHKTIALHLLDFDQIWRYEEMLILTDNLNRGQSSKFIHILV